MRILAGKHGAPHVSSPSVSHFAAAGEASSKMQKDGPNASGAVIGFGEEKHSGVCQRGREGGMEGGRRRGETEECDSQSAAPCPLVACLLESWHWEKLDRPKKKYKKKMKWKTQINLIWGLDVIPHKAAASSFLFFLFFFSPELDGCPAARQSAPGVCCFSEPAATNEGENRPSLAFFFSSFFFN